jgi:hypothetical protein
MKNSLYSIICASLALTTSSAHADLTPEQKATDFSGIVATLDRRYAPIGLAWHGQRYNVLKANEWIEAAKRTRTDAEFYQLGLRYLAHFGHSQDTLQLASEYQASLGLTVDFYDGVLLIDSIDRNRFPPTQYGLEKGDELIAVDGRRVGEWLAIYSPLIAAKDPRVKRALAASMIVKRSSMLPCAPSPGQVARVQVRRRNGTLQTFMLDWQTTGSNIEEFSPVPFVAQALPPPLPGDPDIRSVYRFGVQRLMPAASMPAVGVGQRDPIFRMPNNFQQRLGAAPSDYFFTGTYTAGGHTIGYVRIGTFFPDDPIAPLLQLRAEVQYLNQHTDGLVLDVTRNNGGDANYQDEVARVFFARPFKTLPEQIRPTLALLAKASQLVDATQGGPAPDPAAKAHMQEVYEEINSAYMQGRRLTHAIYPRNVTPYLTPAADAGGTPISYSKPIVLLVDQNSACAAEAFAAVFQDNRRGVVAGMQTQGVGGAIDTRVHGGEYSESLLSFASTLLVRTQPSGTAGRPVYIQNVGITPDVQLNYMTKANLVTDGKAFVGEFTRLIVQQIR